MFKSITIGQYYPEDSFIHNLDSRVKLVASMIYITMLFMLNGLMSYVFVIFCVAAVIFMSKVPPSYMFRGLKGIIMIIVFTVTLNIFFTPGETVLLRVFGASVTLEGLINALKMCLRLTLLVVGSSILTLTTSSIELTNAIEFLLKPLKKIGVPSHEIAMMMTIALRFIPTLMEEADKIIRAQTARGADFDTGGLIKRAKSFVPLLVPLFISAFRRAYELADAMEARCYRGDINRTKMKEYTLKKQDYGAIVYVALFVCGIFIINFVHFK